MRLVTTSSRPGVLAIAAAFLLAACAGSAGNGPAVPSVGSGGQGQPGPGGGSGGQPAAAALHAAAQCIRQHGIPSYADPVLAPGGQVYTDQRSLQDAGPTTISAVLNSCRALIVRAHFDPGSEPPAPPQFVQAGVRSAQCLRAHGLPDVTDPTARSPYTPGHGFGFTRGEIPVGGKASPAFRRAYSACRTVIFTELRASTLGSLGRDG